MIDKYAMGKKLLKQMRNWGRKPKLAKIRSVTRFN